MKLVGLKISNFRSYKTPVNLSINDFTAIVGRNDVGKSTLLEALDIFFNHKNIKLDQSDPCVHSEDKVVKITCLFEDLPAALTIDARSETTLEREKLLNGQGQLEIQKRFDCRGKTPKEEVFAWAIAPSNPQLADLLKLKNQALKERARAVNADLSEVDERSNVALRQAIRAAVGDVDMAEQFVPLSEEDGKKAWDQIELEMPTFALFQADRPSKDDDPEVADPMKVAIAEAVKAVQLELDEIKEKVRQSAMDVANRTLEKLREMDPELAKELTPSFKAEPKWDGFKLTLASDNEIPINKRGSGVRRLILLSFFRAEAERRRAASPAKQVIYAIEEPESSQHPDSQQLLIRTLLELGDDPNTQVLITTHVPGVAGLVPTEAVRLITKRPNDSPLIEMGADDVYRRVADTLGVLPDKRAKVAIYVEGPNDVEFLRRASRLHRTLDTSLLDLDADHRVVFVVTGGGNLQHWVNHQYLENAQMVEVHICDADDQASPKYQEAINTVNARGTKDIGFLTSKREMENYIHSDAIYAEFGHQIVVDDWCDVPDLIAEQIHVAGGGITPWAQLDEEKKGRKVSRAKRRLNRGAMDKMTLALLQTMDSGGEIIGWLQAVRDRA
ncbi:conserved protein of unknown function(containing coiled-coil domain133-161; containing P-loop containing nucleoside triphosphate hydrolases,1-383) [Magnetospirillum sp. XM-1]|uniref:ATP-binding protein n=1 Tax=Magnetospirillum sp. XM-1 TaxID=1663591 RepID=UPI00073DFEA7|nr:ATP-binding protein [Magnetospirillum sp. XM-1]CUW40859.1 conserved protein of unknown function(containing coiled-coil domain133-161; containing P-loop containing nucleoside triphosphate hydrolases,1-383) [Magnetospirillum sp. XM-1]